MPQRKRRAKVTSGAPTRKQAQVEFARKKAQLRRKRLKRRVAMVAAAAVAAYVGIGGWWLNHTGKIDAALHDSNRGFWQLTADMGFAVTQIYLTGREHADAPIIKAALNVKLGDPILALSLPDIQSKLEAIPEIKSATLVRKLPGELHIALTERQPAALWQREGNYLLVDADGVVLSREKYPNAGALPVMVGEDAPRYVGELLALLDSAPTLRSQVQAAVRVGDRRWNLQLTRDITVMLPEDDPAAAWLKFAGLVEREGLLTRAVRSVDMRLSDRVFVMPDPAQQAPLILTNAKDT